MMNSMSSSGLLGTPTSGESINEQLERENRIARNGGNILQRSLKKARNFLVAKEPDTKEGGIDASTSPEKGAEELNADALERVRKIDAGQAKALERIGGIYNLSKEASAACLETTRKVADIYNKLDKKTKLAIALSCTSALMLSTALGGPAAIISVVGLLRAATKVAGTFAMYDSLISALENEYTKREKEVPTVSKIGAATAATLINFVGADALGNSLRESGVLEKFSLSKLRNVVESVLSGGNNAVAGELPKNSIPTPVSEQLLTPSLHNEEGFDVKQLDEIKAPPVQDNQTRTPQENTPSVKTLTPSLHNEEGLGTIPPARIPLVETTLPEAVEPFIPSLHNEEGFDIKTADTVISTPQTIQDPVKPFTPSLHNEEGIPPQAGVISPQPEGNITTIKEEYIVPPQPGNQTGGLDGRYVAIDDAGAPLQGKVPTMESLRDGETLVIDELKRPFDEKAYEDLVKKLSDTPLPQTSIHIEIPAPTTPPISVNVSVPESVPLPEVRTPSFTLQEEPVLPKQVDGGLPDKVPAINETGTYTISLTQPVGNISVQDLSKMTAFNTFVKTEAFSSALQSAVTKGGVDYLDAGSVSAKFLDILRYNPSMTVEGFLQANTSALSLRDATDINDSKRVLLTLLQQEGQAVGGTINNPALLKSNVMTLLQNLYKK